MGIHQHHIVIMMIALVLSTPLPSRPWTFRGAGGPPAAASSDRAPRGQGPFTAADRIAGGGGVNSGGCALRSPDAHCRGQVSAVRRSLSGTIVRVRECAQEHFTARPHPLKEDIFPI